MPCSGAENHVNVVGVHSSFRECSLLIVQAGGKCPTHALTYGDGALLTGSLSWQVTMVYRIFSLVFYLYQPVVGLVRMEGPWM